MHACLRWLLIWGAPQRWMNHGPVSLLAWPSRPYDGTHCLWKIIYHSLSSCARLSYVSFLLYIRRRR